MTTIKATCPTCSEVALTPERIELRVDNENPDQSFYSFICPRCTEEVRKTADERVIRLLVSGGVPALPMIERNVEETLADRFDFPDFTHDDLLDFHMQLSDTEWFDKLFEEVHG